MRLGKSNTIVIAYVPVPHAGYLKFFRAYEGTILYLLGEGFIQKYPSLVRHLPGLKPAEVQKMIQTLNIFSDVRVLRHNDLALGAFYGSSVVMPDEDVSHAFAEEYLAPPGVGVTVSFDGSWRLRWDWGATQAKRRPEGERIVSTDAFDRSFMRAAFGFAQKSPDWWRQIGAILVKDGHHLFSAFNRHVPSEQSGYCYGDPRSNFEQGQCIEVSGALHAEVAIIAEAARRGISMEGCDLYATTFPCPPCAYALAHTGIKRLFYAEGYSLVAGAEALQAKEVEIIRVVM